MLKALLCKLCKQDDITNTVPCQSKASLGFCRQLIWQMEKFCQPC